MQLVLFDIDGTLIKCGRQVRPIFAAALEETYRTSGDLDNYDFAGKTDPQIVIELLTAAGLDRGEVEEKLPQARKAYVARLERDLDREQIEVLPGVVELLDRLTARPDILVGLLTGNWEIGARIKLGGVDLNGYFRFGAFGGDSIGRNGLPPVALRRAEQFSGHAVHPRDAVIIGDSLLDVACARRHEVPSLAVATGWVSGDKLKEAGADWVVEDLRSVGETHPVFSGNELEA